MNNPALAFLSPGSEASRDPSSLFQLEYVPLAFLGSITFLCLALLIIEIAARNREPTFRGHWGGFGNSGAGWAASASLTYLITTIVFATLFAVVGIYSLHFISRTYESKAGESAKPLEAPSRGTEMGDQKPQGPTPAVQGKSATPATSRH